jgi:hypothetical protein
MDKTDMRQWGVAAFALIAVATIIALGYNHNFG